MDCRQGSSARHKDQDDAARRHGTRQSRPATRNTASETRLRITIGDRGIEATLADSDAARDFASLLPLTLAMNDLFRREKFATLPRAISEQGKRTVRHQRSLDRTGGLNKGEFLAHRNVHRSEDETANPTIEGPG